MTCFRSAYLSDLFFYGTPLPSNLWSASRARDYIHTPPVNLHLSRVHSPPTTDSHTHSLTHPPNSTSASKG